MIKPDENDLSDVVLACGVNVKRNYAGYAFTQKLTEEHKTEIRQRAYAALESELPGALGERRVLDEDASYSLGDLIEKAAFSAPGEARGDESAAIGTSGRVRVTLMRGDHINVSAYVSGCDARSAYALCRPAESALASAGGFAFDKNRGYLVSEIRRTGNELTAVFLLHLYGLKRLERINECEKLLGGRHMALAPLFADDDGSDGCEFFCAYTQQQLGISEQDALAQANEAIAEAALLERSARREHIDDDTDAFADDVMRSLGILTHARLLGYEELAEMYSDLRAGLADGFLAGDYKALDAFMADMSPERLHAAYGDISKRDEEIIRADETGRMLTESIRPKYI